MLSIVTVCVFGLGAFIGDEADDAHDQMAAIARMACRTVTISEPSLQTLRVLEVRDEGRTHLDEQRLEFLVRRARNQRLVERIDHLLVVRHFMIDVRLVERRALERLQVGEVLLAVGLQALAGGIVLRRNFELGRRDRSPICSRRYGR